MTDYSVKRFEVSLDLIKRYSSPGHLLFVQSLMNKAGMKMELLAIGTYPTSDASLRTHNIDISYLPKGYLLPACNTQYHLVYFCMLKSSHSVHYSQKNTQNV
ncbi:hypothetical protein XENORESO_015882 [Xenotaenia resolanae]|uniref:Uncharacterized protein n=1 Tax=Xenotaenia resolanae TaxID=208358 RepID=A0ABV0WTZ3_9TELE